MKKEYHADTDSVWVSYKAGGMCDDLGCPMPFWGCYVAYTWSQYRHAYWVYSVQTIGFGLVEDEVTHETEMASLEDVNRYLGYLKDMEACYKKVYGDGE